jgi:hypothetical protein
MIGQRKAEAYARIEWSAMARRKGWLHKTRADNPWVLPKNFSGYL